METQDSGSPPASLRKDTLQHEEVVQKPASAIEKTHSLEAIREIDPTLDNRVTMKCDFHIIPWLFGIWLLAFIDRSNIGNAKIDGLVDDLKLTGNKFNIALVVFYVPYICVDVPSNWIVKHFKAGRYLPFLLLSWGLTSTFLGFTKSFGGLVAARFFLGLCEGGLLGGMIVYLAMFYRRHQMLYRIGLFYCAAPLSGAFGGLLATGLAKIDYHGYNGWPWIFFIEGIITVCFSALAFLFMPSTPADAKFFTDDERAVALARMKIDGDGATNEDDVNNEKFDWHWVRMALISPNTIITSLAWFFLLIPLYSFSLFLPTIIKALGYTSTVAQLFTVPPNMCSFFVVLITAWYSDRIKMRAPFMIAGCLVAIAGYAMLLGSEKNAVRYAGTFFVACGVFQGSPMVMGWLSNNSAPHFVRATATGFQVALANCAAFVATFTYLSDDAINLGAMVLCIITVICGIFYCKWENAKRQRGDRDDRLQGDQSRLGHRHPNFRYTI